MKWDEALSKAYADAASEEAAAFLERLDPPAVADCLSGLGLPRAIRLFANLSPLAASQAFPSLEEGAKAALLEEAPIDVCGALLRRLPKETATKWLGALSRSRREALKRALAYPADTAGGAMDSAYPAVMADTRAADAVAALRKSERGGLGDIFVIDRQHRLVGALAPSDLLLADAQAPVSGMAVAADRALSPFADVASLLESPVLARARVLPVVSTDNVYLGAISYERLARQAREAAPDALRKTGREEAAAALGQLFKLGVEAVAAVVEPAAGENHAPSGSKERRPRR